MIFRGHYLMPPYGGNGGEGVKGPFWGWKSTL